jgi:predicted Rossmann fold nucleotide-binding protein DprA/Smf involved in DNA uptake
VIVTDTSLAALLLTNRIVDVGHKPLSASEFWSLHKVVGDPSVLLGMTAEEMSAQLALTREQAVRCVGLLEAVTAFAFERERLEEEGVRLISALDDAFPARLARRLGDACPAFLVVGGLVPYLHLRAIGVVGSRDASPAALDAAGSAAKTASAHEMAVVSGLARGIDQAAMTAALDAGVAVIGVPSEGIRVAARNAQVRARVHGGELCVASPYGPGMRFTAGSAMGRNKIIYGLAEVTLVVCSESGSGGTWDGAREALRRRFGRVAVWTGEGAGPGNARLIELGASPIEDLDDLLAVAAGGVPEVSAPQPSLFD